MGGGKSSVYSNKYISAPKTIETLILITTSYKHHYKLTSYMHHLLFTFYSMFFLIKVNHRMKNKISNTTKKVLKEYYEKKKIT